MDKKLKLILYLILILFLLNLVALYTINFKVEDNMKAIDVLIEHIERGEK